MKRTLGRKLLALCVAVLLLAGLLATGAVGVAAATYTDIEVGETVSVALTYSQSVKYLRFIPDTTGNYRFYSAGAMDAYGVLTDADDEIVASDDDSGEELNFDMTCYLYAGNIYYLSVSLYGDATGIVDVTVEQSGGGADVDAVLTLDEYIVATDIPVDTASYFSFTPDWDGWYTFYTTGTADTYAELVDEYDNFLIFNDNTIDEENFSLTYYLTGGDTYYLTVWGYGGWTVDYDLYVDETSIYDFFPDGATIEAGETWDCTVAGDADHLYFRFMPEQSGEYTFYSTGDYDPYCFLYDADYGMVYYEDDTDGEGTHFSFTYYYEAGCPYYFMVGDWDAGDFSVTLEAAYVEPDESETIEIQVGETHTVTANWQEFYFVAEQTGWYCVTSYGDCDTAIGFESTPYISNNNDGDGQNFRLVAYCYAGVGYYFYTYNYDGEGVYDVTINAISESNLFPNAVNIRTGDTCDVYLDDESGCGTYRFVPQNDGTYTFYSTGDADSYCYLYDVNGKRIRVANDYYYTADYNFVMTYDFVAGQTYYFQVSAYQQGADFVEYEVHLQEGDFDALKADQILLNRTEVVYPEDAERSYCYAFIPTESDWYRFEFGVDGFLSCTLQDDEGLYLTEVDNGEEADDFSFVYYCEAGQPCYMILSTYGEEVPMYTATVTMADKNALFPEAVNISSGQTKMVSEGTYFRFAPTVSGVYTFASSSYSGDPYCDFINVESGDRTRYDDISYEGGNYDFTVTDYFEAGQVYYFYAADWDEAGFTVSLTYEPDVRVIDTIEIENLRAPEAGETVYDYNDVLWSVMTDPDTLVNDVAVFVGDDLGNMMDADAVFESGETYLVGIAFEPAEADEIFSGNCAVSVNVGTISEQMVMDGFLAVFVEFTVAEEEPDVLLGDLDGNGRVNNRDLGMLQQYLNDWDVDVNTHACDMDGNDRINNRDLGLLQQLLNE